MALTNDHIDQIRTQLRRLGVPDGILSDEYLDHVCCDIEDRMSNGISFQDSMQQVFREIDAKTLRKFQSRATTFRSFRPFDMLKNHFITTIRAFKRSKG